MDDKLDFGEVAGPRIDVISETGWFDDTIFKKNMADYGGNRTDAVPHSHAFLGNGDFVTF